MDKFTPPKPKHHHSKKIPIRKRANSADNPASSSASNCSNAEGTFIPLVVCDSEFSGPRFLNPNFRDEETDDEDTVVRIIDFETEQKTPLLLLFPDLQQDNKARALAKDTSTTQVTKMLIGKRPDFSLLKPSKKLNPLPKAMPPLLESEEPDLKEN